MIYKYNPKSGNIEPQTTGWAFNPFTSEVKLFNNGSQYDPDAAAFFTAAGITDPTQKSAVNTLVTSLKANSLWSKFNAIYPMVGGTATTHKYNLKDPRDLDAAFRLDFIGGFTHDADGALPNGTTGYANTFLSPISTLTSNDIHMSFFSGIQNTTSGMEFGADVNGLNLAIDFTGLGFLIGLDGILSFVANPDTIGLGILNHTGGNGKGYFEAVEMVTQVRPAYTLPTATLFMFAENRGTIAHYSSKQCKFASIGSAFSVGEITTFDTIINTFQTDLGR